MANKFSLLDPLVEIISNKEENISDFESIKTTLSTAHYEFTSLIGINRTVTVEIHSYLKKFLNKEVFIFDNLQSYPSIIWLYWGEGEVSEVSKPIVRQIETPEDITQPKLINSLKTYATLPPWLDDFIFKKLENKYLPDHVKFSSNLSLNDEDIKVYNGTYFPRSFAESFCIFSDVFKQSLIREIVHANNSYNLLDFGSGTGGNILGFLSAFDKFINPEIALNITAVDGNSLALDYLEKIIDKYRPSSQRKIRIVTINETFNTVDELKQFANSIADQSLDLIMSFKCLSELYNRYPIKFGSIYYDFEKTYTKLLSDFGLMLVLDVTTKLNEQVYAPEELNEQTKKFNRQQNDFHTLIPKPCSLFYERCKFPCFTQQQFRVSHSQKTNDLSKVTYRLIASRGIYNHYKDETDDAGNFIIHWQNEGKNNKEPINYCKFTRSTKNESIDAYLL